jgi:hypothetical protein
MPSLPGLTPSRECQQDVDKISAYLMHLFKKQLAGDHARVQRYFGNLDRYFEYLSTQIQAREDKAKFMGLGEPELFTTSFNDLADRVNDVTELAQLWGYNLRVQGWTRKTKNLQQTFGSPPPFSLETPAPQPAEAAAALPRPNQFPTGSLVDRVVRQRAMRQTDRDESRPATVRSLVDRVVMQRAMRQTGRDESGQVLHRQQAQGEEVVRQAHRDVRGYSNVPPKQQEDVPGSFQNILQPTILPLTTN